jgi:hypothetical protein
VQKLALLPRHLAFIVSRQHLVHIIPAPPPDFILPKFVYYLAFHTAPPPFIVAEKYFMQFAVTMLTGQRRPIIAASFL